ncbi:toprim domain-containing protein [Zobellia russellii]|uniref:toprim domain-containing protein n=1 Tax=Zobellia russellii TaxID=248907 RepID=UPI001BFFA258|nr:toprim domain-containing protein [Zobellia russellii]MBT9187767.1 toprim domain-containing protein [Zobellia russellii]
MNCKQANSIPMLSILKLVGHVPRRVNSSVAYFISPFRDEKEPSFKVSIEKNLWIDYANGVGGGVVDFIIKYYGFDIPTALQFLSERKGSFSSHPQNFLRVVKEPKVEIIDIRNIQHNGLIDYLDKRRVSLKIAQLICNEVHYSIKGRAYFSLGLKNSSGGWELRNKYFKNSTSPKDITLINNNKSSLVVTEGMFDLLSLLTINPNLFSSANVIVLNSTSMRDRAKIEFHKYDFVDLYLDNDETGVRTTKYFLNRSVNCVDKSNLYQDYNDLNDFLRHS